MRVRNIAIFSVCIIIIAGCGSSAKITSVDLGYQPSQVRLTQAEKSIYVQVIDIRNQEVVGEGTAVVGAFGIGSASMRMSTQDTKDLSGYTEGFFGTVPVEPAVHLKEEPVISVSKMLKNDAQTMGIPVSYNAQTSDYRIRVEIRRLSAENLNFDKQQETGCLVGILGSSLGGLPGLLSLFSAVNDDEYANGSVVLLGGSLFGLVLGGYVGMKSVPNAVVVEYQAKFELYDGKTGQLIFDTLEEASKTYSSDKATDIFPMPGSEVIHEVHQKFWKRFAQLVNPH